MKRKPGKRGKAAKKETRRPTKRAKAKRSRPKPAKPDRVSKSNRETRTGVTNDRVKRFKNGTLGVAFGYPLQETSGIPALVYVELPADLPATGKNIVLDGSMTNTSTFDEKPVSVTIDRALLAAAVGEVVTRGWQHVMATVDRFRRTNRGVQALSIYVEEHPDARGGA